MNAKHCNALAAVAAVVAWIPVAAVAQSALSPAQQAVIDKKIARTSATEKQMVAGWSDGKKLAEFFCSEVGLKEIAKQHKGANRLFLGPDDECVFAWPSFAMVPMTRPSCAPCCCRATPSRQDAPTSSSSCRTTMPSRPSRLTAAS